MSDFGLNVYNDENTVSLIDFKGKLVVWSKDIIYQHDSQGSFSLPDDLVNKCEIIASLCDISLSSGNRFEYLWMIEQIEPMYKNMGLIFDGRTVRWNFGKFDERGSTYLNIMVVVI